MAVAALIAVAQEIEDDAEVQRRRRENANALKPLEDEVSSDVVVRMRMPEAGAERSAATSQRESESGEAGR